MRLMLDEYQRSEEAIVQRPAGQHFDLTVFNRRDFDDVPGADALSSRNRRNRRKDTQVLDLNGAMSPGRGKLEAKPMATQLRENRRSTSNSKYDGDQ